MSILIVNQQQVFKGENLIKKHFNIRLNGDNEYYKVIDLDNFIEDVFCVRFKDKEEIKCVYSIGCFYIGKTKNLKQRIYAHAKTAIDGKHSNKLFEEKFINLITNGVKCPLSILSFNVKEEKQIIEQYCNFYDLTNYDFNENKSYK